MRSLGTYPTKKEIESHFKTYDKKHGDDVEFSTFLNIMHQQLSQENAAKEILAAFKQSDWEKKGFVTVQEVRQILTRTGEKLTSRECDLLLRSANVQSNGYIKYDEFVSFITSPLPDY
ncbi:Oidioi.mRNA.OKI2018_I69.XSR.g14829.t1.cds [Oikopleura dioica]|uniref:Oidioi.mRNA.OKI2018_I69.XSR.g14829.t1.cds n=1 Tax=Oikopleura dioica TaxID=34765 RepID=A0ABN7SCQ5_OIKDI|nr:Oidioi.mRNA.OKI2018_I69.XSR.g14829.t1.cds [Oikopleura dioica]